MLQAKNITVRLGGSTLLCGVNAVANPGELMVIAGMNGAGKTTLLRVLSGEIAPSAGEVFWDGAPLKSFKARNLAKVRGYLSQKTVCALPFRAIEIVRLGVDASEAADTGGDQEEAAHAAMELCGVTHLAERLIDTLSGGEQQRVHWARVVAQLGGQSGRSMKGKCLLLDEPISALDLAHQHEMLTLARSLVDRGCSVIAVLHDLNLSAEYGDRMVLLSKGSVVIDGTPGEVLTPAMIRTAFGLRVRVEQSPVSGSPCVFVEKNAGATVEDLEMPQG